MDFRINVLGSHSVDLIVSRRQPVSELTNDVEIDFMVRMSMDSSAGSYPDGVGLNPTRAPSKQEVVMVMQPVEEPFDEYEKQLLSKIDEIERCAHLEAEPYIKLLAESRSMKPIKYIVTGLM